MDARSQGEQSLLHLPSGSVFNSNAVCMEPLQLLLLSMCPSASRFPNLLLCVQNSIVNLIAPERVTVVGDDRQTIYGFRGSLPYVFNHFRKTIVQAHGKLAEHSLKLNYR